MNVELFLRAFSSFHMKKVILHGFTLARWSEVLVLISGQGLSVWSLRILPVSVWLPLGASSHT